MSQLSAATYPAYIPSGLSDLPQGTMVRGRDDVGDLAASGHNMQQSRVSVEGRPFANALRVEVSQAADNPWGVLLRLPTPFAVRKGDVMVLVFWARAEVADEESGEGWIDVLFERRGGDYAKSLAVGVGPNGSWQQYAFAFECRADYAADSSHWGFNFGSKPQAVEIGGIDLIQFGTSVTLAQLDPCVTKPTYGGRAADAPWRAAAAQRIEHLRKANVTITVVDKGNPVSSAAVHVAMKKHAFGFGTAIAAATIQSRNQQYCDTLVTMFNKAVVENKLKWKQWTVAGQEAAQDAIDWMREQGLQVRGHVLVWPSWERMPSSIDTTDARVLQKQILDHIDEAVSSYKGKLVEWDVINEPYANHDAMDLIGKQAMIKWFEQARKNDPDVKLYINDYGILAGDDTRHREHYDSTIQYLIDGGASLDGIGVQCHFGQQPTAIPEVLERLDLFARFGKEIQVTEFDIDTKDEQLQADYTRDFLTVIFSHPSIVGFLVWGFWEGRHWRPEGAMYRVDWTPKPNAEAWRKLVYHDWWTDEQGTTDADGVYALRGFKGEYEVTVGEGAAARSFPVSATGDVEVTIGLSAGVAAVGVPLADRVGRPVLSVSRGRGGALAFELSGTSKGGDESWVLCIYDSLGRRVGEWNGRRGKVTLEQVLAPGAYVARMLDTSANVQLEFAVLR